MGRYFLRRNIKRTFLGERTAAQGQAFRNAFKSTVTHLIYAPETIVLYGTRLYNNIFSIFISFWPFLLVQNKVSPVECYDHTYHDDPIVRFE